MRLTVLGLAALPLTGIASVAIAQAPAPNGPFTTVNDPIAPGEDGHQEILNTIFGEVFDSVVVGDFGPIDFESDTYHLQRLQDRRDYVPTVDQQATLAGRDFDDLWSGDWQNAEVEARFAVFNQSFGWIDASVNAGPQASVGPNFDGFFNLLFENDGFGYDVDGQSDLDGVPQSLIKWARGGSDRVFTSDPEDNSDLEDHLVSYEVLMKNPLNGVTVNGPESDDESDSVETSSFVDDHFTRTWLLFWEDEFETDGNAFWIDDWDFNDFVVEITLVIPEPAAASVVALAAPLMLRRRRA